MPHTSSSPSTPQSFLHVARNLFVTDDKDQPLMHPLPSPTFLPSRSQPHQTAIGGESLHPGPGTAHSLGDRTLQCQSQKLRHRVPTAARHVSDKQYPDRVRDGDEHVRHHNASGQVVRAAARVPGVAGDLALHAPGDEIGAGRCRQDGTVFGLETEERLGEARGSGRLLEIPFERVGSVIWRSGEVEGSTATVSRQTVREGGGEDQLGQLVLSTGAAVPTV